MGNNIYIDGTLIHTLAAHGYGQLVFQPPCSIFHQDHPRSFNTKGSLFTYDFYENIARGILSSGRDANHRPQGYRCGDGV